MVLDFWNAESAAQAPPPQIQPDGSEPVSGLNLASEAPPEDVIPDGAWGDWARRPRTLENRLADHTMQIRRDLEVLAGDPKYYGSTGDREFYESRIAAHRREALQIGDLLAQAEALRD